MNKWIRKLELICITALIILSATACNNKTKGEQSHDAADTKITPTTTVQEITATPTPVLTEEEKIKKDLLERSLFGVGNNSRMKKVLEKARNGEDVTIAFIGGSITEGYNAGTTENFAKLTTDYFAETYSSADKVHLVNAGLSGTPSSLGLIRSDRDIFAYKPDIIFIEFAVNDAQSGTDPAAYESLIAKALKQENEPAVVLLFSVTKTGYTCQSQMALTGFKFKVPMISVTNALQPEIDAGRMTWADWSNDEAHPNANGHLLYSEFIINYLNTVDAAATVDEPAELPTRMIADYTGMQMYDKSNTEVIDLGSFIEGAGHNKFPDGWMKSQGTSDNKGIQYKMTAKSLFIVYKQMKDATYGTADVYVDGVRATNLPGNSADGWGNPVTAFVFNNKDSAEHTIEIKMAAGDEDKAFAILAFGVCQ